QFVIHSGSSSSKSEARSTRQIQSTKFKTAEHFRVSVISALEHSCLFRASCFELAYPGPSQFPSMSLRHYTWRAMQQRPGRAVLTMLSVVIGVTAAVATGL